MKLLILGGTQFVGRHITQAALDAGHDVTLFNRGKTNADLFPQAAQIKGDRRKDVSGLAGTHWDAVIDVNGYLPEDVQRVTEAITADHYTFVSTISVYAQHEAGSDENTPLLPAAEPDVQQITGETYGPLKVACEQAATAAFTGRCTIIRPGLVAGPYDHTDRFTYYLVTTAAGGTVAAPGTPDTPIQVIDGRDLARFTLLATERRLNDTYDAVGNTCTLGQVLEGARSVSGSDAQFTWLPDDFLLANDITPWQDFPLWLPHDMAGTHQRSNAKATAAGLALRPLEATLRDLWQWWQQERTATPLAAGISAQRAHELLTLFASPQA
jgi:2'-hydroxyisoflavone reductase